MGAFAGVPVGDTKGDAGSTTKGTAVVAEHHTEAVAAARDGRWDDAHRIAQEYDDALSSRIHGYLHWVEGDLSNARYWYGRAGVEMPGDGVEDELLRLEGIVGAG